MDRFLPLRTVLFLLIRDNVIEVLRAQEKRDLFREETGLKTQLSH